SRRFASIGSGIRSISTSVGIVAGAAVSPERLSSTTSSSEQAQELPGADGSRNALKADACGSPPCLFGRLRQNADPVLEPNEPARQWGAGGVTVGNSGGLIMLLSTAQSYWERNPEAASKDQWTGNPVIGEIVYRRMSGGESPDHWLTWLIRDYFQGRPFA